MRAYHDSWMELAGNYGLDLRSEDLHFISGFIKTTHWVLGSVHGPDYRGREAHVQCDIANLANLNVKVSVANEEVAQPSITWGPQHELRGTTVLDPKSLPRNQCIFINYYKMKRRLPLLLKKPMQAAAGPHVLPRGDDPDIGPAVPAEHHQSDDSDVEEVPPPRQASLRSAPNLPRSSLRDSSEQILSIVSCITSWRCAISSCPGPRLLIDHP